MFALQLCFAFLRSKLQNKISNMTDIVLKQDWTDKIKNDPMLFGKVADTLKISPLTLPRLLQANDVRLTQANVLEVLRAHFDLPQSTILTVKMQVYA
jgi:hypothetical protein